ncbi:MAG: DUF2110 family protein [Candidatus Helarchaeota archaeon]
MKELLLIETVYGPYSHELFRYFKFHVNSLLKNLELDDILINLTNYGNIFISFSGNDEEFAYNLLKKEYHLCKEINNFNLNTVNYGKIVEIGKYGFGIFVNIGAFYDDIFYDALLPLYKLRSQLVNNKIIPVKKIIDLYGLINEMPIKIIIEKIDIAKKKIEIKLSDNQLKKFKIWTENGNDRININGVLKRKIIDILKKTGHDRDIIKIEQLGLFEYSLLCKEDTSAPGIISNIGKNLPGIEMNAFIPKSIKKEL